jgi:DNA repair protein SbcC/Rad50
MAPLEDEMQALAGAEARAQQLQDRLSLGREHERQLAVHAQRQAEFVKLASEVSAIEAKAGEYFTARERITTLKVTLKSHLLPSLNKVASALLAQMTGGERYRIEVDDDFEILVDGQALNTLSGSGKAVANLAIRIALGQILTNRVFSLFMADEVDAAMDEDRAEYTAQSLRRLTTMVTQVILVTHKRPETDRTIELAGKHQANGR